MERLWDSDIGEIQKAAYYSSLCDVAYNPENSKIKEELVDLADGFISATQGLRFSSTVCSIYKSTREKMYELVMNEKGESK